MTSISDSIAQALADGRAASEARMTETVMVALYTEATDPNGDPTHTPTVTRYSGKARVKYPSLAVTDRQEPSQVLTAQEPLLSVPWDAPALHDGDEVHVTGSTAGGRLVGRVYRINGEPQDGQTTSARYPLLEV